jgi:hypothetical protein
LKVQGFASLVCITLLASLGFFQIMYYPLNLLLHFFYHIRPEKTIALLVLTNLMEYDTVVHTRLQRVPF